MSRHVFDYKNKTIEHQKKWINEGTKKLLITPFFRFLQKNHDEYRNKEWSFTLVQSYVQAENTFLQTKYNIVSSLDERNKQKVSS